MTTISDLLEDGFAAITGDFRDMMGVMESVLDQLGLAHLIPLLPVTGDPNRLINLPKLDQSAGLELVSLCLQLLNLVEQHATHRFRNQVAQVFGPQAVSGALAQTIHTLRLANFGWDEILAAYRKIGLELVFTAHPTESRRSSLIAQLKSFFKDLDRRHPDWESRWRLHIEGLLTTGEFIHEKPSVATERDVINRMMVDSLPDGILNLDAAARRAFLSMGCPIDQLDRDGQYRPSIRFRSWVASDRDGHPYVTADETSETLRRNRADAMAVFHHAIESVAPLLSVSRYRVSVPPHLDDRLRELGVVNAEEPWRALVLAIRDQSSVQSQDQTAADLYLIADTLRQIGSVELAFRFGDVQRIWAVFSHALVSQDIRQNSATFESALCWILERSIGKGEWYRSASESDRLVFIAEELRSNRPFLSNDYPLEGHAVDAINSLRVAAELIRSFGRNSLGSIIVSMTRRASDLLQVVLLAREAGLMDTAQTPSVCLMPIVPLIETAADHDHILDILNGFLDNPTIQATISYLHQVSGGVGRPGIRIMCGHSDGGKDAGILDNFRRMSVTRDRVTQFLHSRGLSPLFFEGIGGTLIRGAAPIHYLIANSLPREAPPHFEYTEQGQIIAQNHLTPEMTAWTLENAISALLHHALMPHAQDWPEWLTDATGWASNAYRELVHTPHFTAFFSQATPLDLFEFSRMGSRPTRRTGANTLSDLRAIPFALCQSQSRFNITAWFGVGTMLHRLQSENPAAFQTLQDWVHSAPTIRFILTNVEMAVESASLEWMNAYSNLVTSSSCRDSIFQRIQTEYHLTRVQLNHLFGQSFKQRRPKLARTIALRNPILDALHRSQIDVLKRWRLLPNDHPEKDQLTLVGLRTINAIASGLRGTG